MKRNSIQWRNSYVLLGLIHFAKFKWSHFNTELNEMMKTACRTKQSYDFMKTKWMNELNRTKIVEQIRTFDELEFDETMKLKCTFHLYERTNNP